MSDAARVAVYLDFDNMVISRYDHLHGKSAWRKDNARDHAPQLTRSGQPSGKNTEVGDKLVAAMVDVGALIDYATSFGTVAFTRAYADWSVPANAAYRQQLIDRAVDLTQLFATSGTKNGADIRLSIDAVADLSAHTDITHVVIVGGDSDYIALAQRCKMMGRYVVGIGVTGATSAALVSACDEFMDYSGIATTPEPGEASGVRGRGAGGSDAADGDTDAAAETEESPEQREATELLVRAVRVGVQKSDDEWVYSGGVKSQMQRMNSTFKEKQLGFSSFRAFCESRSAVVRTQLDDNGQLRLSLR